MHQAIGDALRDIAAAHDLESAAAPHLEEFDHPIAEASAAVGLGMYRRARWVASILDAVTYYTHQDLPILGEASSIATLSSPRTVRATVIESTERERTVA